MPEVGTQDLGGWSYGQGTPEVGKVRPLAHMGEAWSQSAPHDLLLCSVNS